MVLVLTRGSRGAEVEKLQSKLAQLGLYERRIDGFFGRFTRDAVCDFHERYLDAWARRETVCLLPVPRGLKAVEAEFGTIQYKEVDGGYIQLTDDWAERNIGIATLPVVGNQSVHIKIAPVLEAVLDEIQKRGLDGNIETFYCWCPRHQRHDPRLPLSLHSWAIAVDINAARTQPGTHGDLDPGSVDVFERYGFQWGGRWKPYCDPMHFQYAEGV